MHVKPCSANIYIWFSLGLLRLSHHPASTCACRCLCLCVRLLLDSPTVKIKSDAAVLRGTNQRWARCAQPKVATICSGHQREGAEHRSARRKVHDDAHDHRSPEIAESVAHDHLPLELVESGVHDAFLVEVVEVCHGRRRELLPMRIPTFCASSIVYQTTLNMTDDANSDDPISDDANSNDASSRSLPRFGLAICCLALSTKAFRA